MVQDRSQRIRYDIPNLLRTMSTSVKNYQEGGTESITFNTKAHVPTSMPTMVYIQVQDAKFYTKKGLKLGVHVINRGRMGTGRWFI